MADATGAYTTLSTVTLQKQSGTDTIGIARQRDGALKFTDADGNVQYLRDPLATKLFDAFTALDA